MASRRTKRPFIVAMTLAEEMAAEVEADREHRDALVSAALDVGQWLADQGRPGRWDTVDAADVLRLASFASDFESSGYLLALAGLFGYAAFHGHLPATAGRRILRQIERLTENPVVKAFAAQTAGQLHLIVD